MSPGLVRLPATRLDHGALADLARCADLLAEGRTVLVSPQRDQRGGALDPFAIAAALAALPHEAALGVAVPVGAGRAASVVAREATAAQLLGACDALLLEGEPRECHDAALVITALFTDGAHTVTTATARVEGARNLPLPSVAGGPPVRWRDGDTLTGLEVGDVVALGRAATVDAAHARDDGAVLVEVRRDLDTPARLAAALAR